MKGRIAFFVFAVVGFTTTSILMAAAAGGPEVDGASATFSLNSTDATLHPICTGADGSPYFTVTGTWTGFEIELPAPNSTIHDLFGILTYKATLTGQAKTGYLLMTGTATLRAAAVVGGVRPGTKLYSGSLTIVGNLYGFGTAQDLIGRGMLDAKAYLNNNVDGSVVANIETNFSGTAFSHIDGRFGNDPGVGTEPVVPDYSVSTNGLSCP